MARFAKKSEIAKWNELVLANPDAGNVFQSYEFAQQKKQNGWRPRFSIASQLAITVLEKNIIGLGKLWYIPKGPGVASVRQLDDMLPKLKNFAAQQGVFAIKIEPELKNEGETVASLAKLGLVKVRPIQPNSSTVLLDTSPNPDTILKNLNQKGRHAIRRAQRDGVQAEPVPATDKNCQTMYKLLAHTASGQFQIRSYNYYKTFWQRFESAGYGQMFFATFNNTVVAGAYAVAYGSKGTYKDGASLRERTAYGASHLLQWRVIEWMKEQDVSTHDLCGTPPASQISNSAHPHYGLGRFKTSFNKQVTDYIGAYDIVIKPTQYKIWSKIGERVTLRLTRQIRHESWY